MAFSDFNRIEDGLGFRTFLPRLRILECLDLQGHDQARDVAFARLISLAPRPGREDPERLGP